VNFGQPLNQKPALHEIIVQPPAPMLKGSNDVVNDVEFMQGFERPQVFFIPSKCAQPMGVQDTPVMYNEFTSRVVDESPEQVLEKLSTILSTFSNDIDITVNQQTYVIDGLVFMRNMAVFFKISIWNEPTPKQQRTRFEFRRTKGDTASFQDFWSQMLDLIHANFANVSGDDDPLSSSEDDFGGMLALDYNFDLDAGMDEDSKIDASRISQSDLDNFVQDVEECDPSMVYSLGLFLQTLQSAQSDVLSSVFAHVQFLQCLIQSALTHQDTAFVRAGLVALDILCNSESDAQALVDLQALDKIVPLLQHDSQLIRKYSVRVLSKLSDAKQWKFSDAKLKRFASIALSECQSNWKECNHATADFVDDAMFNSITDKLVTV
jgi:hypothetical protein